jgi:hypothetical protein
MAASLSIPPSGVEPNVELVVINGSPLDLRRLRV